MAEPDDAATHGVDVQSIVFRPGETDTLVEITYSERSEQARGIAVYKVMMFESRKASQMVFDILESVEDLVDEILTQKAAPPDRIPGRRVQA